MEKSLPWFLYKHPVESGSSISSFLELGGHSSVVTAPRVALLLPSRKVSAVPVPPAPGTELPAQCSHLRAMTSLLSKENETPRLRWSPAVLH